MFKTRFKTGYGQGGYGEGFYGGWQGPGIYPSDEYYYALVTSQYQSSPNFMALVKAMMKYLNDALPVALTLYENFDLDTAVGSQLDVLGTYLGITRVVGFQPSGKNLLFWTQDLENPVWLSSDVVVSADNGVDPLGGNTADLLIPGNSGNSYLYQKYALNGRNGNYTFTAWLRAAQPLTTRLNIFVDGLGGQNFRAQKICNVTPIWQPFSVTANVAPGSGTVYSLIGGNFSWTPVQGSLWGWGTQLEAGFAPTAYLAQQNVSIGVSPILDDATFRILLRAKLIQNHWDGRISSLQKFWQQMFPGGSIVVIDNQNMSITVICSGTFTSIIQDLIVNGYVIPRPQGVSMNVQFGSGPFFGFGLNNQYVAGFGVGKFT